MSQRRLGVDYVASEKRRRDRARRTASLASSRAAGDDFKDAGNHFSYCEIGRCIAAHELFHG